MSASLTIAEIAPGEMGAAVARRLSASGARILTDLAGRSPASARAPRPPAWPTPIPTRSPAPT